MQLDGSLEVCMVRIIMPSRGFKVLMFDCKIYKCLADKKLGLSIRA